MSLLVLLATYLVIACVQIDGRQIEWFDQKNVVTVPPNCRPGQQFINGQCRDVWPVGAGVPNNVITVPPNCPPGQQFINGQCREVWPVGAGVPNNVITVPPNCPPGQQFINGQCRDVWPLGGVETNNVITVPSNCPTGQQLINGVCRDVWNLILRNLDNVGYSTYEDYNNALKDSKLVRIIRDALDSIKEDVANNNIITVPNKCPAGQKPDSLGFCRPTFD